MTLVFATSSGLIKWGLLGKILWLSAGLSIAVVVLFTVAVNSLSACRRDGQAAMSRTINLMVVVVATAAIVAALVWGLYYVIHK
ncbi:MAG TPA: hypothetical protein VIJ86_13135 [Acidimicrobiales bacterium]